MAGRDPSPLSLGRVAKEAGGDVIEGALVCGTNMCKREHPIIDGIPIVVADVRAFVAPQLSAIRGRDDLSDFTNSVIGDCAGPDSELGQLRYHISAYARGHYGDLDPDHPAPASEGLSPVLGAAFEALGEIAPGVWIDIGCSVGRGTFELAARTDDLVIGVDLSFGMLQVARHIARTGRLRYDLRRVGIVYDPRSYEVRFDSADRVAFWACDAGALPFEANHFAGAMSMNLLDCMGSPLLQLCEMGRALAEGAPAVMATPYDWSTNATPIEHWIGGHSQRGETGGSSAAELLRLLAEGDPAEANTQLVLTHQVERVPWHVYVHERATMAYQTHLVVARALASARS